MVNIKGRSKIITVIFSVVIAVSMLAVPMPGAVGAEKAEAKTSSSKYYIAVNKRANVATVYVLSRGKYRPFRAMLVSCGGSKTPSGTFRIGGKRRWGLLIHNLKGQYCTTITGQILFHSVWYSKYSPSTQSRAEYNKLGKTASAGCVRLAVIDAKWIYDNCPAGTKVRIYSSSNPGPLGKPTRVTYKTRSRYGWDPTDPAKGNPKFCLRPPVLTISKSKKSVVEYGQAYNLKYGVTAKNPNALQNITNEVTIPEMYRYRRDTKTWVRTKLFSTKSIGQYKIKYSVKDRYCRGTKTAYFKVTVRDSAYPSVSVAKKTLTKNDKFSDIGVKTRIPSKSNLNGYALFTVTDSSGITIAENITYNQFSQMSPENAGKYTVKISVKNPFFPDTRVSEQTFTVNVESDLD